MVAKGISIFCGLVLFMLVIQHPEFIVGLLQMIVNSAHKIATSLSGLELQSKK